MALAHYAIWLEDTLLNHRVICCLGAGISRHPGLFLRHPGFSNGRDDRNCAYFVEVEAASRQHHDSCALAEGARLP